ncbi:LCP family protein [Longispora albida]|uniref:LCP family protein n=1 Tax=Longispora albida TaxID=203523 RepID=UPI0003612350|nr:LCP family protein [Longispora albida]
MATTDKAGVHRKRKSPLWARICLIFGMVLTIASVGTLITGQVLIDRYTGSIASVSVLDDSGKEKPKRSVKGPINILLAGIDARKDDTNLVRSDTVMWAHIPASLDRVYLLALPRDLQVSISKCYGGNNPCQAKLNAAFAFGSGDKRDLPGGLRLLRQTVESFTGVKFDMAGMIDWYGFTEITGELGGVTMCLDQGFKSTQPGLKGYQFQAGCNHYNGHSALALVRQRYDLPGGDNDRQKLQQQFIGQIIKQATSKDMLKDPKKLDAVIRKAGRSLQMDLGGFDFIDLVLALRGIKATDIVPLSVPHTPKMINGESFEILTQPLGGQMFQALIGGQIDAFIAGHPELASKLKGV